MYKNTILTLKEYQPLNPNTSKRNLIKNHKIIDKQLNYRVKTQKGIVLESPICSSEQFKKNKNA